LIPLLFQQALHLLVALQNRLIHRDHHAETHIAQATKTVLTVLAIVPLVVAMYLVITVKLVVLVRVTVVFVLQESSVAMVFVVLMKLAILVL